MNSKVEELNNSLEHYKNIEATLQNTLVVAQSTAEEVKNVAKQQADQIINEAKAKAEEIIRDSKETSKRTLDEIEQQITIKTKELDDLKKQMDVYKAKMESLLISQLELLKVELVKVRIILKKLKQMHSLVFVISLSVYHLPLFVELALQMPVYLEL